MKDNIPFDEIASASRTVANLIHNGMPNVLAERALDSWVGLMSQNNMLDLIEAMPHSAAAFCQYCFMQGYVAGSNHPKETLPACEP